MKRLAQAKIAPVIDLFVLLFAGPLPTGGPAAGRRLSASWCAEFNQFLRLAIRHPNGSGVGSEEEKMFNVHSVHLTLRAVRLLELCEAEGFDTVDELVEASTCESVCPAICMECGCTAEMEPDQRAGYCDECRQNKVVSALVLAGTV
jgi:hypothetical protein